MQLHYAGHEITPEDLSVYLNPSNTGNPFAVVRIDRMQVFLNTPEEADALIKIAVEAKRLLSPPVMVDSERTCNEQPESAQWTKTEDGSQWRAELPDGRTAVIERVLGEDGLGSSTFLPKVYESRSDFETGPVCDGVLAAAAWVTEQCIGVSA